MQGSRVPSVLGGNTVIRNLIFSVLILLASTTSAFSQSWARKMFKVTSHDFGTVARGSKQQFEFNFTNLYKEDIQIAGVRTSCGCTTPTIKDDRRTIKTHETGTIVATYNTHSFLGNRSATITVTINKPFYAEVQLSASGYIRSDVVFSPGVVNFGETDQGTTDERKIKINYAGRNDWKIVDIRSANPSLEVELSKASRSEGRVKYEMLVKLKPDAKAGFLQDELIIVTDDQQNTTIPLTVEGRIISPLTVSPASLFIGIVEPGEKVTKQLIVRGNQPFKVTNVGCPDGCFHFKVTDQVKKVHRIPITFTAGKEPGKIEQTIEIQTDLGAGMSASCVAVATVKMPQPSEK